MASPIVMSPGSSICASMLGSNIFPVLIKQGPAADRSTSFTRPAHRRLRLATGESAGRFVRCQLCHQQVIVETALTPSIGRPAMDPFVHLRHIRNEWIHG